jgi:hypothetical protein
MEMEWTVAIVMRWREGQEKCVNDRMKAGLQMPSQV